MKKLAIILCFWAPIIINAQTGWNLIPPLSYPQPQITDMLVDGNNIVMYGDAFNNSTEWKQGLIIAKIDSNGNIINQNFILDILGDKLSVSEDWGKIVRTHDGGYAATAATVHRESAFLIKLNQDLTVEYIKEYPDSINLSNFDYKLREVPGGYLLFGSIQLPDYNLQGFVKYVDYEGGIIWERFYSNAPYGTRILDLDTINDSLFVFVTVESLTPYSAGSVQSGRSGIYFINIKGESVKSWQSGSEPEIGYLRRVIVQEKGGFITYGVAQKDIFLTTKLVQPTLAGLDDSFSLKWLHNFGKISSLSALNTMWDFTKTIDGNYVGCGKISAKDGDEPSRGHGWLYKFSPDGDSIWGRSFSTPFLPDYYLNSGRLYGVGMLTSGSIVAGGTAKEEGQFNHCWIVKLTNDGCMDTLFCQTVSIFDKAGIETQEAIVIYPNPAQNHIYIESPEQIGIIRLMDMLGREIAVYPAQNQHNLKLNFPPGITKGVYLALIQYKKGNIVSKKVYVE